MNWLKRLIARYRRRKWNRVIRKMRPIVWISFRD